MSREFWAVGDRKVWLEDGTGSGRLAKVNENHEVMMALSDRQLDELAEKIVNKIKSREQYE